ncbi:sigma 54-interacting transcriptional regulator [Rufibacter aurantiacus]|uniref:sigma 54-interacting transcriptional regulator n=1 Tax=Rufibacter aurantiacus TaxID=2817374 RepID=UPI001B3044C2|nr:sigma-54 dependent transcriptional regulator [Rufibacter aurantiacus]
MAKLLISWIAYNNDFLKTPEGAYIDVNSDGPHYQFHQHFFKEGGYDKHILLYASPKQEGFAERLAIKLRGVFKGHSVEHELLQVQDIISLEEVKTKSEGFLLKHAHDQLDIFFSPGTSIMQLSWYICHQTLGLQTKLIQTKAARFSSHGKPELMEVKVQHSETPVTAILKETRLFGVGEKEAEYKVTDSIAGVYNRAYLVAQTDKVTALIRGESGTGKEHLARYIHDNSVRKNNPFIAVNCAALAQDLLESRLFGFKKGAFTGANQDTPGFFSLANGGTIFLDEIGDITPGMQQALLRVLQEREIQPIGGKPEVVDVRVIAATNAPLEKLCREASFRWDLYYRLCVAELELPCLLERGRHELAILLDHFLLKKKADLHKKRILQLNKEARQFILQYPFPGNIRELENLIESLYVFCPEEVSVQDLPRRMRQVAPEHSLLLKDVEREHILKVLEMQRGNQRQTALSLGVALNTLKAKLKSYGVLQNQEMEEEEVQAS